MSLKTGEKKLQFFDKLEKNLEWFSILNDIYAFFTCKQIDMKRYAHKAIFYWKAKRVGG